MAIIRLKSCARCKHGEGPGGPDGQVECRRYPPCVIGTPMQGPKGITVAMQAVFPRVHPDLHCGEWEPKISVAQEVAADPRNLEGDKAREWPKQFALPG